jgi:hypothetical protein
VLALGRHLVRLLYMERLPYIDEHDISIGVPPDRAWAALEGVVADDLRAWGRSPLTLVLGTEPRAGFAIVRSAAGERLVLRGRHRFSRYELAFDLLPAGPSATRLRATTHAAFPGPLGRVYRGLVIGTRLHVVATRRILAAVARRAGRQAAR